MTAGSDMEKYMSFPLCDLLVKECGMCKILSLTFKQLLVVHSVRENPDELRLRLGMELLDVAIQLEYGPKQFIVSLVESSYRAVYSGLSGVRLSCCSGMSTLFEYTMLLSY